MMKKIILLALGLWMMNGVIAQPPKNAVAFYKKGLTQRDKGMYPEAMRSFKQATILYKKYDSAWLELGNLSIKLNSIDTAILYYKKAIAANPRQALAYTAMGNLYRDNKSNTDSALQCYFNAMKIDSTNKLTFYNMAWCYNAKKAYDSAIIYAIRALDIDNNYRQAYGELAHAYHYSPYHASNKYKEAIEQFKKNATRSEIDLPLYYAGMCYMEIKQKDGALEMVEALKKIGSKMAESLQKRIDAKKDW